MSAAPELQRSTWRQLLAAAAKFQHATPSRKWFSIRAGLSISLPVVIASLLGFTGYGMLAALGGLTSLYGSDRPYRARAVILLMVATAFAAAVGLGNAIGHIAPWAVIPMVALFAMVATWLCNALRMGPPGAYLFMLSCAGGSAIPSGGLESGQVAALVFAGGMGAWLLHMAGALFDRHGPEIRAVWASAVAVRGYLQASGNEKRVARRMASLAVHDAWQDLVAWQPRNGGGAALARLRGINRQWHVLLAAVVEGRVDIPRALMRADELDGWLSVAAAMPDQMGNANSLPLGRPGRGSLLWQALARGSHERGVIVRVGIAAAIAGTLASLFGLERAYWAMGAAVLMLHAGSDWQQTVVRSIQRLVGTWTGLLLAAAVLWWQPQGLWMAALLFLLQFSIEMLVMRNYALAAVFITATGMTLATGGQPQGDPNAFLLARGLDTLLGCGVALAVLRLMPAMPLQQRLDHCLQEVLKAAVDLNSHLAWAELTSPQARHVRARLGYHVHALDMAWEHGRRQEDRSAERAWPEVFAVQELAYRLLATAWHLEYVDDGPKVARHLYGRQGVVSMQAALREIAAALEQHRSVSALPAIPAHFSEEVGQLVRVLDTRSGPLVS